MKNTSELIFVIVPFYNEEKLIGSLVETFKKQTDQVFHVIYVNNNSTDTTVSVLQEAQKQSRFSYEIIEEKIKGTGSASDAGFRYAINTYGAVYLARTDADCLPDFKWVHSIRENLILDKLEFIAGIIKPRTDDVPLTYFGG